MLSNEIEPAIRFIFLIDLHLPVFRLRFAVNRASRVCPVLPLSSSRMQRQELIRASSIAIWNKIRVVTAISFGVWVTNIAFLIQGEPKHFSFRLPVGRESRTNTFGIRHRSGNESIRLFCTFWH
jgi:hypothetical protein